jgi:hypothetical protein
VVLNTRNLWDSVETFDLGTFKEGLISLQDTLLGSKYMDSSILGPFYLLCLYPCEALSKQVSLDANGSTLRNISVTGYNLCQLQEVLLELFHALSTYINIIRWYVTSNNLWKYLLTHQSVSQGNLGKTPRDDVWNA